MQEFTNIFTPQSRPSFRAWWEQNKIYDYVFRVYDKLADKDDHSYLPGYIIAVIELYDGDYMLLLQPALEDGERYQGFETMLLSETRLSYHACDKEEPYGHFTEETFAWKPNSF